MNNNDKIMEILTSLFNINVDSVSEIRVEKEIGKIVVDNFKSDSKYENLNISIFVKDTSKVNWKPKDHFTKIFNNEIKNATELYDLKKSEVLFYTLYHLIYYGKLIYWWMKTIILLIKKH